MAGLLDIAASALGFALADTDQNVVPFFFVSVAISVSLLALGVSRRVPLYIFIVWMAVATVTQFIPPFQPARLPVAVASGWAGWLVWSYLRDRDHTDVTRETA